MTSSTAPRLVALAGNPNVGKTTVFNRLTGLRQRVGNYPGVTVERKVGMTKGPQGEPIEIVDIPGLYSLNPESLDEEIAYRALLGLIDESRTPDLVVVIVDAGNLERNLYLASQILDLGLPTLVALNMLDTAAAAGLEVDAEALSEELGVPVLPLVASRGEGLDELRAAIAGPLPERAPKRWVLDPEVAHTVHELAERLQDELPQLTPRQRTADVLRALSSERAANFPGYHSATFWDTVREARGRLEEAGVPFAQAETLGRYAWIGPLVRRAVQHPEEHRLSVSDRLDAVLTHRWAGPLIFVAILALIFQAVFAWAGPFMDAIDDGTGELGAWVGNRMADGPLRGLLVDGVIAGVGAVVIFLPQILILFFFLGLLEDTGYMARAAFIMDRAMRKVGLSGRSVVPLLSSFACAIPGIMATRTINNPRDRLVTILVAPLMTCSARLPVYTLLIGAFIPQAMWFGILPAQSTTLLILYLLGVVFAIGAAWVLKRFVVKGERSLFVMELPPYRLPSLRDVLWRMVERSKLFLSRAGTIILAISIVLWFLASFPKVEPPADVTPNQAAAYQVEHSAVGWMGQLIEPVIEPLGYDWKVGVAVIASFAAREVAVSALATIYSVGEADEESQSLRQALKNDVDPDTGQPVFTSLVAVSLMIFYVLACQCMSTVAVVKRETESWWWAIFLFVYMTVLAWVAAFVTYQGGLALGLG